MRPTGLLLSLAILLGSAASAAAKPAYVLTTVNLRAAPGTTNAIVAKIPGGSLIEAEGCTNGWCAVNWGDKRGFAIQSALDLSGRVPRRGPPPGYAVEDGPVYYEDGPPPPVYYGPVYRPYWGWHHRYWW